MGARVREVRVEAVQEWEQTDLLGLWGAQAGTGAEAGHHPAPVSVRRRRPVVPPNGPADPDGLDPQAVDSDGVVAESPASEALAAVSVTAASVTAVGVTAEPEAPEASADADRPAGRMAAPISLPQFPAPPPRGTPPVPERLLILDTETTALRPEEGACIEVGAVLFHVATRSVLTQVSFLLPCEGNAAEAINGIPAAVSRLAQPWREALSCFLAMAASADAILAHNAAFDRQWFGQGLLPPLDKPWICSMEDISWPPERHLRATPSVRDLALAHGVPVWAAHRALTDCTYLVQVLERCDDLETLLRLAGEPRQLYRAQLGYNERQQAKDAGFRWNEPVAGAWTRRLSEREAAALPFPVRPVVLA